MKYKTIGRRYFDCIILIETHRCSLLTTSCKFVIIGGSNRFWNQADEQQLPQTMMIHFIDTYTVCIINYQIRQCLGYNVFTMTNEITTAYVTKQRFHDDFLTMFLDK